VGHESVVYRDRHAIIHDLDFWALRHFMLAEAETTRRNELVTFISQWGWIGPGVWLDVEFDKFFASDPEREAQFLELLSGVARRLMAFGTEVPLDYLREHINMPLAFFTAAQPVERWQGCIEKLRALFTNR
jgi:hypothetical protein